MALYNNPYQYSFGVPGQMNQFQQQPVQMPTQPVQQPQQNNNGILWVSGEVGAKSYLVAPGTSVLLMDSESEKFYIKSTDVSGMDSQSKSTGRRRQTWRINLSEKMQLDMRF